VKAAVIAARGELEVRDVPEPAAGAGEVVLRVGLCGICGSDLHEYASEFATPGRVMGHEYGGTIIEVGAGVTGWAIGDRVVAGWPPPCGRCYWCRHGQQELCDRTTRVVRPDTTPTPEFFGAYAPLVRVRANRLFRVPDVLDDVQAASVEPLAVGVHAVRASAVRLGAKVLVIGAGPIGLYTLQAARAAGAATVVVSEMTEARSAAAQQLGADAVLDPRGDAFTARLKDHFPEGPDVVFDCAGIGGSVQQAVDLVKRRGNVVLVGVPFQAVTVRPAQWVIKEVRFKACFAYRHDEFPLAIELLARGDVDVAPLITHTAPLSEIARCFHELEQPNQQIKIMIDPSDG
jgi:(R,R)-butanediol dehydrogenase / meso-butanediol dehydrogenase / diacetyl reductase